MSAREHAEGFIVLAGQGEADELRIRCGAPRQQYSDEETSFHIPFTVHYYIGGSSVVGSPKFESS